MVIMTISANMEFTMNNAAHQIAYDNEPTEHLEFSNLLTPMDDLPFSSCTINFADLLPIPSNLKSDAEIKQWCLANWKNISNPQYTEIVDELSLDFESDTGPCLPFIKLWAEKYKFTGEYRAISSDLKEWVVAHFQDGIIDKLSENDTALFNSMCYELRGFHYYEVLQRDDDEYIKYLADVIAYHSDYRYVMDGQTAQFSKNEFNFDLNYDQSSDQVTVTVNGEQHVSPPLQSCMHPSGILENFVDVINAIYKAQKAA